jgi:hypothetical protein
MAMGRFVQYVVKKVPVDSRNKYFTQRTQRLRKEAKKFYKLQELLVMFLNLTLNPSPKEREARVFTYLAIQIISECLICAE